MRNPAQWLLKVVYVESGQGHNAAMNQGHRSEAFSVAYCRCVIPQIFHSMPASVKKAATKEQAENFTVHWVEENPVALGACLKTGQVAEGKS